MIPLAAALPHEQIESRRVARLSEQLRADGVLKNPPIVTPYRHRYILLDGATRTHALAHLGCRDVVAQIVQYDAPGVALETWNHLLADLPTRAFTQSLRRIAGLRLQATTWETARAALARRESIGAIALADGRVWSLRADAGSDPVRLLNQVVAAYEGRAELYRVLEDDAARLFRENARASALVLFPRYRPDEIRQCALDGSRLPAGITRHIIPGRVMRLNVPLDWLRDETPLEEKNAWLGEWLQAQMRARRVRLYPEPVFLFDE